MDRPSLHPLLLRRRPRRRVRYNTTYTNGDQKTETVTFVKGTRERFEFQDMVLIKQHDEKRTIQISRAAKSIS